MKKCLFFFLLIIASAYQSAFSQNQTLIDSLSKALEHAPDSTQVMILLEIQKKYKNQPQQALKYAKDALQLAQRISYKKGIASSLFSIGIIYKNQADYTPAIEYYLKSVQIRYEIADKLGAASAFNNIGEVYRLQGNYAMALEYYFKSLKIKEEAGDKKGVANSLSNVALIYLSQNHLDQSQEYHLKALALREQLNDLVGISTSLHNLGEVYEHRHEYDKALDYFTKSLQIDKKLNDKEGIAVGYQNIGQIYEKQRKHLQALSNYLQALKMNEELESKIGVAAITSDIARLYGRLNQFGNAISFATRSLEVAQQIGAKEEVKDAYTTLHELYARMGDKDKAYQYVLAYIKVKDSLFNAENTKALAGLQNSYEAQKKQAEISLLTKDRELLKRQNEVSKLENDRKNIVLYMLVGGLGLVFVLAFVLYRGNQQKQKANMLLEQRRAEIEKQAETLRKANEEITLQGSIIQKKNNDIQSSIRYAKRIQTAMLPYPERIAKVLPEHFTWLKPRDIVSGDFYWFHEIVSEGMVKKAILAAVDCTGHGVPGAFMSMIGESLLNQIVMDKGISDPGLILKEMHKGVRKALQQEAGDNRDGMDLVICTIDFENKNVLYGGAKNSLVYVQNNELVEIKGDKMPVGGMQKEEERNFTTHVIEVKTPTEFYLLSDGFQDQFGGEEHKKFGFKKLKEQLLSVHHYDMDTQKEVLSATFEIWKGSNNQIDDVMLIGMRIDFQKSQPVFVASS